ncbi:MAG: hypothetical protein JRJ15_14040 [Deltaproteobacteria bacterium]|nr:hypothetical protein [Deltaproteobacteria bacterium]
MKSSIKNRGLVVGASQIQGENYTVQLAVDSGICGFPCVIEAGKITNKRVLVQIIGSECEHVKRFSAQLSKIETRDLFKPISRNPAFLCAERAGCHPSCPAPVAVVKAVEVAMELALPRNVCMKFVLKELEDK